MPRSRLLLHIKIRRYRGAPARQRGRGIVSVTKRLLPFGQKAEHDHCEKLIKLCREFEDEHNKLEDICKETMKIIFLERKR